MLHPTEVKGRFRAARVFVRAVLVIFIVVLPWIKINGHQALLLDIVHRRFSILGNLFFAQDVPLLFLLIINFVLAIALITALFGRIWCGWMCPQTVFIEGVFRRIEKWTEGKAEERRKHEGDKLDFEHILRKTIKWFLFTVFTLWITHSILAIFIGSDQLLQILKGPFSANPAEFVFILISNAILLGDFGILREQFCIVACPYGKFQSVLQDRYTVSIAYDSTRGEPRRGLQDEKPMGDCVDCLRCVKVCPTGIDIRNGSQLECIACTACVDACDDVMTRLHKPKGLIGYWSEAQIAKDKQKVFRPRIAIYSGLMLLFGSVAIYEIFSLKPFEIMLYKTKGAPFSIVHPAPGVDKVTNLFSAELSNKSGDPLQITLKAKSDQEMTLVMPNNPITLAEGQVGSNPFTLEFDQKILKLGSADSKIVIDVKDLVTGQEWTNEEKVHVIGPF